jgi:hypothetical protein
MRFASDRSGAEPSARWRAIIFSRSMPPTVESKSKEKK